MSARLHAQSFDSKAVATVAAPAWSDRDLSAMREAARSALFAMHDETRHWQPHTRPPGESAQVGGETAFCCWALLESGVAAQDPRLAPALASLSQPMDGTYAIAARILVRASLLRKSLGSAEASTRKALESDVAWITAGFSKKTASWGYAQEPSTKLQDNSIRQFVALALLEANSVGVKTPASIWRALCTSICASQSESGGWAYQGHLAGDPARGSITAGLLAALSGMRELEPLAKDARLQANAKRSIERASQWLASRFDANANPGSSSWWVFWIFALERAAQANGSAEIGGTDWLGACCASLSTQLFSLPTSPNTLCTVRERLAADAGGTRVRPADLATALLFIDRALRPTAMLAWSSRDDADDARALARNVAMIVEERDEVRAAWWVAERESLPVAVSARTPLLYVTRARAQSLDEAQCDALRVHAEHGGIVVINLAEEHRASWRALFAKSLGIAVMPTSDLDANVVREASIELLGAGRIAIAFVDFSNDKQDAARAAIVLAQLALPFQHDAFGWPSFARELPPLQLSSAVTIALISATAEPEDTAWLSLQATPPITVQRVSSADAIDQLVLPCIAVVHGIARATPDTARVAALRRLSDRGGLVLFESPFGAGDFARRAEVAWIAAGDASDAAPSTLTPQDFLQQWPALKLEGLRWRPAALVHVDLNGSVSRENVTALRLRGTRDTHGIRAVFSREDLSFGLLGVPHAACVGMQPTDTRRAVQALLELAITRAGAKGL